MIDNLTQVRKEFTKWWSLHDVLDSQEGTKLLHHPIVGKLRLRQLSFQLCDAPDLIATLHIPSEKNNKNS